MSKSAVITLVIFVVMIVIGLGIYVVGAGNSGSPPPVATGTESTSTAPTPNPVPAPAPSANQPISNHMITLHTNMGDITFETYDADAPKTVENFITLAQKGFYDNVIFHRVIKGFMIQGGDPTGTGRGGPGYMFDDELNSSTPSYKAGYQTGVVAMANSGPNTNGSQFFIMLVDTPLQKNYTIFGKVTTGQDVVNSIGNLATDAGDRPLNPPIIKSVTVNGKS